ncbi:hypothetical protein B7493_03005 [Mycobacterium tuberculosis variant bovis]|nr:hypothetical protein B7493_03005 [Mycobacterium tuberculosis variant bovis]
MSFVVAAPEVVVAAASDLAGIGSAIGAANAAAAVPTMGVLAAGADEVSAAVADLFGAHAQAYQALSAQAALFHEQFVHAMTAGAGAYAGAEAADAAALDVLNGPFQALFGRPLIGDGANGAPGQPGGPGGLLYGNGGNGGNGGIGQGSTLTANVVANVIRNVWSNAVIFCGHFPDGAEKFTKTDMIGEPKGQWYLRQMLGSANFNAGPALRFMSGNLCHQIEHHLYPDLPSNRLHEISVRVREVCDRYDLPYTTGSFLVQYGKTWRTLAKLSLPDKYLRDNADDAPETRSERMFAGLGPGFAGADPVTGRRRGLKTAIAAVRGRRRSKRMAKSVTEPDDLAA